MDDIHRFLREHFGYENFRPGQESVVESILQGRPTMVVMPTGGGKSLGYQLPALMLPGLTLVVSPLISLMKDQVDALAARGLPATFVNSSLTTAQCQRRLRGVREREAKLLYIAPERVAKDDFQESLGDVEISLFAVDEAHCISQWGHDFRPDYLRLGTAIDILAPMRIAAFTATASPTVRVDIISGLKLLSPAVFIHGFSRPNLRLRVKAITQKKQKPPILQQLLTQAEMPGIIYCATRRSVEAVHSMLVSLGVRAVPYHGGLETSVRTLAQQQFLAGEAEVVVATNAFGMGIDKPNVRFVVHYEMPGSIEAYYQEIGRAGRDGLPSDCVLFFFSGDINIQRFLIDKGSERDAEQDPTMLAKRRDYDRQRLRAMTNYACKRGCRHRAILRYFGDPAVTPYCQACDDCIPSFKLGNATASSGYQMPKENGIRLCSRFSGRCLSCGERFPEGEMIVWYRGQGSVHEECREDYRERVDE